MYDIKPSTRFKKDFKKLKKSGRNKNDIEELLYVIDKLAIPEVLPPKYKDHGLIGNYKDYRECHICPNLLLVYRQDEDAEMLNLARINSHSELF